MPQAILDGTMQEGNPRLELAVITWADRIRQWGIEWHTGIYPGEMAAFLALCDLGRVRTVIESGRGEHGYSTQVLAKYGEETGTVIVSIDLSPVDGTLLKARLEQYPSVRCLVGNTFDVLPEAVRGTPIPIGLLLDGPKLRPANRLSLVASVLFDIRVVAHHNCPLSSPWGIEFSRVFPDAFHYEGLSLSEHPEWRAFKEWERGWVKGYEVYDIAHEIPGRSLEASSLAMAMIPDEWRSRKRLGYLQEGSPRYNPLWLWLKWNWQRLDLWNSAKW